MECAQCTLGAYASAMSMAFAANLLVTAWASFYGLLESRERDLENDVEALANDNRIEEEVGIETLQELIARWQGIRRCLWWIGLRVSLAAAVYFYVLAWHVSPDTDVASAWWLPWTLWVAAYAGPATLALMALAGMWGTKEASKLNEKLQKRARDKKEQAEVRQRRVARDLQAARAARAARATEQSGARPPSRPRPPLR